MSHNTEVDITKRIDRLEEIAEALENGDIGLEHAKELREEADKHLETLGEQLDVGDGDIIELDEGTRNSDTVE